MMLNVNYTQVIGHVIFLTLCNSIRQSISFIMTTNNYGNYSKYIDTLKKTNMINYAVLIRIKAGHKICEKDKFAHTSQDSGYISCSTVRTFM